MPITGNRRALPAEMESDGGASVLAALFHGRKAEPERKTDWHPEHARPVHAETRDHCMFCPPSEDAALRAACS